MFRFTVKALKNENAALRLQIKELQDIISKQQEVWAIKISEVNEVMQRLAILEKNAVFYKKKAPDKRDAISEILEVLDSHGLLDDA